MAIWSVKSSPKKFQVKVKGLKLEELQITEKKGVKMAIEVKWEGPVKSGISSLYKKSHQVQSFFSKEIELLKLEEPIEWNNEFDHICNFSISSKDPTLFSPWIVTFHILYVSFNLPNLCFPLFLLLIIIKEFTLTLQITKLEILGVSIFNLRSILKLFIFFLLNHCFIKEFSGINCFKDMGFCFFMEHKFGNQLIIVCGFKVYS